MPRSSRSSGSSRPAARPAAPMGSRGMSTMSAPASSSRYAPAPASGQPPAQQHYQQHQAPATGSQAPGLFGQMASTAAGVAVGSTVGHGISNMLFGGRAAEPAPAPNAEYPRADYERSPPATQYTDSFAQQNTGLNCEVQAKQFVECLEKTNEMNACTYFLEQLKACQAAARGY